jgi:excisionase family DNA binding protein
MGWKGMAESKRKRATEIKPMLLTVPELAKHLRLSRGRTYILLARGDLPRIKVGGAIRIDSRDLESYLNANRRKMA